MAATTYVQKSAVLSTLRSRNLHDRAAWFDKQFPDLIDTARNAALLRTLDVDIQALPTEAVSTDVVSTDAVSHDTEAPPAEPAPPAAS